MNIKERLFDLQDLEYRDFQCNLMPTVASETVIGVRTPLVRKLSKELSNSEEALQFMENLPHEYYEENNLHAFLIENIRDFDACIEQINRFLPYVNNWATCDSMSPKVFKRHLNKLYPQIMIWLDSNETYTVRFAIECLMNHYLGDAFNREHLEIVSRLRSKEYYINMMIAWYFATALAKQYDDALDFIKDCRLDRWTHNKAIQKAIESRRITDEQKKHLKTLKYK